MDFKEGNVGKQRVDTSGNICRKTYEQKEEHFEEEYRYIELET